MQPWPIGEAVAAVAALVTVLLAAAVGGGLYRQWQRYEACRAVKLFRLRREQLEARFFDLASAQGKPRGLKWLDCDWQRDVLFARDKKSGLLTAFVAVNIRFEAVEGGGMEEVAAVGTVREAVALFHYRRGVWGTGGRALFNMNPSEALRRLAGQFEPVGSDLLYTPV
uniref:Uncharacterized protein n=1 Tax=Schlesneria paludicola TaxID=360056 RepID=A0A7C4LMT1_9PLAN